MGGVRPNRSAILCEIKISPPFAYRQQGTERKEHQEEAPMKDGSDLDYPLPIFLSGHVDEPEEWSLSRVLKAGIAIITVVTVSAIIAITITLGNPVTVFADATAQLAHISAPRPTIQLAADTSVTRSIADAQVPATTANAAPTQEEVAAAPDPITQSQIGNSEPQSDDLLGKFQAWAGKQNVPLQKSVLNARAEMRHVKQP
jgi:hypothetical protein